jgi:hypothetical protein
MNRRILIGALVGALLLLAPSILQARWMNPNNGRFWTMDSAAGQPQTPLSLHKYIYCYKNVLDTSDPSGFEVAYANHLVVYRYYYSKLVITPDNQNLYANDANFQHFDSQHRRFATIGAGPEKDPQWPGRQAMLTFGINRKRDVEQPALHKRVLPLPLRYGNEDQAIAELFRLGFEYNRHRVEYSALPRAYDAAGWNSNSFISGLISVAGYEWFPIQEVGPADPNGEYKVPGWNVLVPQASFGNPLLPSVRTPSEKVYDTAFGGSL